MVRQPSPSSHWSSTGLLLHYQSHVDSRYKSSLITTMLQRAWHISSSWQHFTDECERLEIMFCKLKYPQHMVKTTIQRFTSSRITVQQHLQSTNENLVRVVLPFKDQRSADIVRNRLKDLSCKGKFECLLYEMPFIQKEKPPLNIQSDSLRAKLFM